VDELISQLTSQLGVSTNQAKGGAGLLFKLAKDQLSGDEFAKVQGAVGGVDDAIAAAPVESEAAGLLGGLTSALGGGAEKAGSLASLASGFDKLGLDAGMISKFLPIVLAFVQGKGGDAVKSILGKVLGGLAGQQ
jgi:hypothetical protein